MTSLQLPFNGSWFVFWGGDTKEQNYHHGDTAEKYALDMVVLDEPGSTYKSSGSANEDYYAFGQDILAVADGEIIEVVDGLRDNLPQKTTNNYLYPGNFVMIKHTDGLFSVYEHLRQNSTEVKAGQKINAGQKLGECGNSGNSTEPHLHFHVQNDSILTVLTPKYERKPLAKGVKAYFACSVTRETKTIRKSHHAPVKGDILSSGS